MTATYEFFSLLIYIYMPLNSSFLPIALVKTAKNVMIMALVPCFLFYYKRLEDVYEMLM